MWKIVIDELSIQSDLYIARNDDAIDLYGVDLLMFVKKARTEHTILVASVADRIKLTSNHLPLIAVGSNPCRDFGYFYVMKLSSWLTKRWWFYSGTRSCLKKSINARKGT
jgi:hypothetical protein